MFLGRGVNLISSSKATHRPNRNKRASKHTSRLGNIRDEITISKVGLDGRSQASYLMTNDLYAHFSEFAAAAQDSLYIAAPFIRVEALDVILRNVNLRDVTIITTWTTRDILEGASDLNVYPYLRSRRLPLYLYPRLHAKILVSDLRSAIVTSANITKPGLGLCEHSNTECASEIKSLSVFDHLWLSDIVGKSLLVQDEYFLAFKRHIDCQLPDAYEIKVEEFNSAPFFVRQQFLLNSLPMSDTPEKLLWNIEMLKKSGSIELEQSDIMCTLHDMALFSLSCTASHSENMGRLRNNFFACPLISAFAESIKPRKFFGETKAWIQSNCTDVPAPRRSDLTSYVRVLFDWFVALGGGEYIVERPNYSECLVHVS